jgi:AraC-like DNA-binding protein
MTAELSRDPLPNPPPPGLIRAAFWLRRALQWLADQVVPAEVVLRERSGGIGHTQLLGAAARHRIPDLLAAAPLTAEQIAERAKLHPDATHRVMRALVSAGIFERLDDGRFQNSRLSAAFQSGRSRALREWLEYFGSASNVAAWSAFEHTLLTGNDAFRRVFGMDIWKYFEEHPGEQQVFARSLQGLSATHAPIVASLYPFSECRILCDVGGGAGLLLSELLLRFPHLTGVLQDVPGVLETARELCAQRGVADRVRFHPGNFFEHVPSGADTYLLKNVVHDWDDVSCGEILDVCRRAMTPRNRILILETLLDDDEPRPLAVESDVHMMVVCANGRERTSKEIRQLLGGHGFETQQILKHPLISVVEAVAV